MRNSGLVKNDIQNVLKALKKVSGVDAQNFTEEVDTDRCEVRNGGERRFEENRRDAGRKLCDAIACYWTGR